MQGRIERDIDLHSVYDPQRIAKTKAGIARLQDWARSAEVVDATARIESIFDKLDQRRAKAVEAAQGFTPEDVDDIVSHIHEVVSLGLIDPSLQESVQIVEAGLGYLREAGTISSQQAVEQIAPSQPSRVPLRVSRRKFLIGTGVAAAAIATGVPIMRAITSREESDIADPAYEQALLTQSEVILKEGSIQSTYGWQVRSIKLREEEELVDTFRGDFPKTVRKGDALPLYEKLPTGNARLLRDTGITVDIYDGSLQRFPIVKVWNETLLYPLGTWINDMQMIAVGGTNIELYQERTGQSFYLSLQVVEGGKDTGGKSIYKTQITYLQRVSRIVWPSILKPQ